ncbi:MAG: MAB_1171c family putative transporter [Pseudonocardiaceae bacterium]
MTSAVFLTAAALTLSGATYKAVGLRGQPVSRPAVAFAATLFALGLALVLRAPVIAGPVNDAAHLPNLNVLLGNSMTLISAYSVLTVLVYFTEPASHRVRRKSRLRLVFLAVALAGMTGLFVWSLASPPADFLEHRSGQSLAYVLIYVTYLAAGMTDACQLCVRYARHTAGRYLRLGLQLVALGSALGILYCAVYGYNTVAAQAQLTVLGPPLVTSTLLPATTCVLLVIGSTIGGWGPRLTEAAERLADYRSYRKLGPLWRALAEVAPEVIPPQDMASLTIGQKRYRRVIEIRDMILTLRAYRDPTIAADVVATAAPTEESSLATAAAMEATVIASAIRARREGRLATGSPDIAMPAQLGTDLATESHWLEAVSAALTRSAPAPPVRPHSTSTENAGRGRH